MYIDASVHNEPRIIRLQWPYNALEVMCSGGWQMEWHWGWYGFMTRLQWLGHHVQKGWGRGECSGGGWMLGWVAPPKWSGGWGVNADYGCILGGNPKNSTKETENPKTPSLEFPKDPREFQKFQKNVENGPSRVITGDHAFRNLVTGSSRVHNGFSFWVFWYILVCFPRFGIFCSFLIFFGIFLCIVVQFVYFCSFFVFCWYIFGYCGPVCVFLSFINRDYGYREVGQTTWRFANWSCAKKTGVAGGDASVSKTWDMHMVCYTDISICQVCICMYIYIYVCTYIYIIIACTCITHSGACAPTFKSHLRCHIYI